MAESVEGANTSIGVDFFVRQATGLVRELSGFDTFIMVCYFLNGAMEGSLRYLLLQQEAMYSPG